MTNSDLSTAASSADAATFVAPADSSRTDSRADHMADHSMTFTPPASLLEALTGGAIRFDLEPGAVPRRPARRESPAPVAPIESPASRSLVDSGALHCSNCNADITRVNMTRHGLELVFESCSPCGTRQWTRDGAVVDFDKLRAEMATTALEERTQVEAEKTAASSA